MAVKYNHLFSEGKIGNLKLRNRIVMPPMGTNFANADGPSVRLSSIITLRELAGESALSSSR